MINPCNECLVKVNCTEICPDKTNFQTLLKNAVLQFSYGGHARTPKLSKLFNIYRDLSKENNADMCRITSRRLRVRGVE